MKTIAAIASGPFLSACALLCLTGLAKLRQPRATSTAISGAFHRPVPDGAARLIGVYEVALGLGAAVLGGAAAAIVAATYAAFTMFALLLRRTAPDAACGCLGDRSTRVAVAHLVVAVSAAAIASLYALAGGSGARTVLDHQPFGGVPLLTLVACCAVGATLLLGASNEEPSWPH